MHRITLLVTALVWALSPIAAQKKAATKAAPPAEAASTQESKTAAAKPEPGSSPHTGNMALALSAYGGLPYAHSRVSSEKLLLFGANLRFDYALPRLLAGRLSLLAQADMQRFAARTIPAWGASIEAGAGFLFWQKSQSRVDFYGSGGMALGKVEAKEDFRLGLAELGARYSYGISQRWQLITALRQQFYFDPVGFFTATALQIGGAYVF